MVSLPKAQPQSTKSEWTAVKNAALQKWKWARQQVKMTARVFQADKSSVRRSLEDIDEFVRDWGFEPEDMKGDYPELFFDYEKDSHHIHDEIRDPPSQTELDDKNINKATSFVPRETFIPEGRILKP